MRTTWATRQPRLSGRSVRIAKSDQAVGVSRRTAARTPKFTSTGRALGVVAPRAPECTIKHRGTKASGPHAVGPWCRRCDGAGVLHDESKLKPGAKRFSVLKNWATLGAPTRGRGACANRLASSSASELSACAEAATTESHGTGVPATPHAARRDSTVVVPKAYNAKLSPVRAWREGEKRRLHALPPFVAATYASIAATCSDACPFKAGGCFVPAGTTKKRAAAWDAAARGLSTEQVIAEEVRLLDAAFRGGRVPQDGGRGGRDLRLHVGGDVGSEAGARLLAGAAERWVQRDGGRVWTFTNAWRDVPKDALGHISVLASVERPEDIELARTRGYAAAIVVEAFPSSKAFSLPGTSAMVVPCPAETKGTTCIQCRLYLNADALLDCNVAIAFAAHSATKKQVIEKLVQLGGRVTNRGARRPHPFTENAFEPAEVSS